MLPIITCIFFHFRKGEARFTRSQSILVFKGHPQGQKEMEGEAANEHHVGSLCYYLYRSWGIWSQD